MEVGLTASAIIRMSGAGACASATVAPATSIARLALQAGRMCKTPLETDGRLMPCTWTPGMAVLAP